MLHEPIREQKIDLSAFGYAPGTSFHHCLDCNDGQLHAGHKHSYRCATHALLRYQAELRACEGQPSPEIESCVRKYRGQMYFTLLVACAVALVIFWAASQT